tara:strand:- start:806 stop:1000 length:195 start_codon:yes stop_codon:yes gene_type:complete
MRNLESNAPVMWRREEYRFVKYSHELNMGWITQLGINGNEDNSMQHVATSELDLILEFDFGDEQ